MLICGTSQGVGPFLTLLPPFASLLEGFPKSFVYLQSWGKMTFPEPVAVNALRSSWQEVSEAGTKFLLHSHWADPSQSFTHPAGSRPRETQLQSKGPCAGARAGSGRRRRMHKKEEVTLHHCKGFEFRKKKIQQSIIYRIDFKKCISTLFNRVLLQISRCTSHIICSTLSIFWFNFTEEICFLMINNVSWEFLLISIIQMSRLNHSKEVQQFRASTR